MPSMRVVNAFPLIVLSLIARLDLLREPRPNVEVSVPHAVLDEVMRGEAGDPALRLVPEALSDWLRVVPTLPTNPSIRADRLDPGEISVLSLALEHRGWEVVLDDQAARREAARLGIRCIGTVGLLLIGHTLGTVPSVREALDDLRNAGMYIADALYRVALDRAGE